MSNRIVKAAVMVAACLTSLAATQRLSAQSMEHNRIGSWEFGIAGGALFLDTSLRGFLGSGAPEYMFANTSNPSSIMPSAEARIGYNFTKHFNVSGSMIGEFGSGMFFLTPTAAITLTTDVNATTAPFFRFGSEITRITGENERLTHSSYGVFAGIGLRHMLTDNMALNLEGRLRADKYQEVPMVRAMTYNPMAQIGLSWFGRGHRDREVTKMRVDTVRVDRVRVDTVRSVRVDTVRMAAPAMPAPAPARPRELFTLKAVLFEFDKATLTRGAKDTLGVAVRYLQDHSDVRVEIQGNTDSKGSDEYNMALGLRRAESVKEYLSSKGIDAGRIRTMSKGESEPVADNEINGKDNPAGRALNRRVVVIELP